MHGLLRARTTARLALAVAACALAFWLFPAVDSRTSSTEKWCERLAQRLEAVRAETGSYPETISGLDMGPRPRPAWILWYGVAYQRSGDGYTLRVVVSEKGTVMRYREYSGEMHQWRSFGYLGPGVGPRFTDRPWNWSE